VTYPAPPPHPAPSGIIQPLPYHSYAGYAIATGPAPGLAYAGFWIRFVAYLIDGFILDIPLVIVFVIVAATTLPGAHCTLTPLAAGQTAYASYAISCENLGALITGLGIAGTLSLLIPLLYFVVLWGRWGRTVGQKLLGLRVVDANTGTRISYTRALLRYVGVFIASIPFSLGLMWAGWDARKQGWHDKIAGTFVVKAL